jgi:hypothetical protein
MHPLLQRLLECPEQQTQYIAIRRLPGARKEGQTVRMWAAELCRRREVVGGTQGETDPEPP